MPGEGENAGTESIIGGASAEGAAPELSIVGGADGAAPEGGAGGEPKGDQSGGEDGAEGGAVEGEGSEPKGGAPESYEAFALPEGITLNEEANAEFTAVAKELNLDQAGAQKLVDIAAGMMQRQADGVRAQIEAEVAGWRDAVMSDPEIGKANFQETLRHVAAARDAFASPELVQFLNDSNLGTHPEIVRVFAKVGKAIGEDTFVAAGRGTPQNKPFFDHPTSAKRA